MKEVRKLSKFRLTSDILVLAFGGIVKLKSQGNHKDRITSKNISFSCIPFIF